ncbi:MAG: Mrr restriction system protein [Acidobacteria bacterium]|nr:Mrr restriction system protein [Acidobacteriota bacterium]
MAEITQKRLGELTRKVVEILLEHKEGLPAKELLQLVERSLPLTEFEKSNYPSNPNVRRFEKIVRFGTIVHVKAGWLLKEKGRWSLTEEGERAFHRFPDPEKFKREANRLYREWAASRLEPPVDVEEDTPPAAVPLEEAEETAWTEIQDYLQKMNPYDFQRLVAALLRAMGYHVSWISPPGADRGIDILAHTDPLGTSVPRIKVQVKRRADKINVEGLRSFMALLGDQDVGIFVSLGGFTKDAEDEARTQEKRKVTLLGLEQMFDLWVQFYQRIAEDDRRLLPLRPVHFLAPAD